LNRYSISKGPGKTVLQTPIQSYIVFLTQAADQHSSAHPNCASILRRKCQFIHGVAVRGRTIYDQHRSAEKMISGTWCQRPKAIL
jgi:hypothetical protein